MANRRRTVCVVFPEINRCLVGMFSEKGVEMGRVFECKAVRNFFSRVGGLRQQGFSFVEELLMDEMAGTLARAFFYDGTEVVWVHKEFACIKVDRSDFVVYLPCGNMSLDGLMEFTGKRSAGCCDHRFLGYGGVDALHVEQ
jgi:hypothetical protein